MSDDQEPRARKLHEGWIYHQPTNGKDWTRYWMVLRGNMMFIFASDKKGKEEMKGTLTLGPDTELRNLPSESKKKGFKFELATSSSSNERKINRFKFDKDNDRDLWKAFIVGIAVGIVPSDVHLLPGQLKDVHEAIGEVRNRPPPLPTTTPRPRLSHSQSSDLIEDHSFHSNGMNHRDDGSDDSGSFKSHMTGNPTGRNYRSESLPNTTTSIPHGVDNLRQLKSRQREIALRELPISQTMDRGGFSPFREPEPPLPDFSHTMGHRQSSGNDFHMQASFHSNPSPQNHYPTSPVERFRSSPQDRIVTPAVERFTSPQPDRFSFDRQQDSNGFSSRNGHSLNNNNQQHMFYLDGNAEPPTWFFEIASDSRQTAEQILTMGRRYGNVLMRTSTSFGASGKYVISMRREVAGGTKLDHYEVIKTHQGYKINVDNKHSGMRCLSDVMDFFITVAGQGTIPMRTNDLDKIFGRVSDPSISPAPPMSPSPTTWSTMQQQRRSSADDWSMHSHTARPNSKLNVTGNLPSGMANVVRDINYGGLPTMSRRSSHDSASLPLPPVVHDSPVPPPMPAADYPIDYPDREYVNTSDVLETPNSYMRQDSRNSLGHIQHGMGNMTLQQAPSPPPAPPISGFETMGSPPPPPPIPSGGFGAHSFDNSDAFSPLQVSTTPRPSISQPANRVADLQAELMSKLKSRKEEIYATAQILTN